jgi:TubC N-terminal docking domain
VSAPADLIESLRALGVELLLSDSGRIRFSGPDSPKARELVEQIRLHRDDVIRLLQQQQSWPASQSYAEHVCRLRAAGLVPCSRAVWESEHGDDNARMARYGRLCRWGASREVVQ